MHNRLQSRTLLLFTLLCSTFSTATFANTELDRKFSLETVGCLRSYDNVDGLFTDYVAAAFKDYFSRQSRFKLQDLSKADTVLNDAKTPYFKIVQDSAILGQLARAIRAETLIRTSIQKEGRQYRFKLEWLLSPKMDLLADESFILAETSNGTGTNVGLGDVQGAIEKALDKLIAKLPFVAQISGRDNNSITVDLGMNAGLRRGDTLLVSTLEDVKLHPLLHSVVEWRMSPIGKVEIEEVDEKLAFGKIIEEEETKKITRYMKVTSIIPVPILTVQTGTAEKPKDELPKLGYVNASVGVGSLSRQYSGASAAKNFNGGGLLLYPKMDGQLWLTREWFVEAGFGYGFESYGQTDSTGTATAGGSVSATTANMKIAGGYSYLVNGSYYGPKGMVKFGYQTQGFSLPYSKTEFTDSLSFSSILLGLAGELPIRNRWAALLNIDFGLFAGGTETNSLSGAATAASMAKFYVGAQYHFETRTCLRFGMDLVSASVEYPAALISHKILTFGPALLYYF